MSLLAILVFIGGAFLMLLILAFSISLGIAKQRIGWDIARRMKNRAAYLRGRADAYNAQAYGQQPYPEHRIPQYNSPPQYYPPGAEPPGYGQPPPPSGYGPPQGYTQPLSPPEGRFE